jgi:hypothetical protein
MSFSPLPPSSMSLSDSTFLSKSFCFGSFNQQILGPKVVDIGALKKNLNIWDEDSIFFLNFFYYYFYREDTRGDG